VETNRPPAGSTVSGDRVKLNGDRIRIEADQLTYDVESETITAEGNVIVTTDDAVYHTESVIYHTKDYTGTMGAFSANLKAQSRDFKITGAGVQLSQSETLVTDAGLTRCPLEKPHYQFTAKTITITGRVVHLENVVLRIKGIPVFYLSKLSINLDQTVPSLETGFSDEKGFRFAYNYLAAITPHFNWSLEGELTSRDESKIGLGLESTHTNYRNKFSLYYNLDAFWEVADVFNYENEDWFLSVDGNRQYSGTEERELGFGLTRKYWDTSLGRWQIGVLAREVSKEESAPLGGLYTGWRLDYNPRPNLILSYLGITSHTDREFGDLLEDYGLGDNWLYNVNIPIRNGYSLGLNGVYNSDRDGWIHQIYSIGHESCCFKTYLGYDTAKDSVEFKWNIKF
jgi:lipopolysaccharide export system protein LptA